MPRGVIGGVIGRVACLAALALAACAPAPLAVTPAPPVTAASPADTYGALFVAVQMRHIFPDGKTFVDATPRRDPAAIMAEYARGDYTSDAALRAFVLANFDVPGDAAAPPPSAERVPIAEHIRALWPVLTRPPLDPPTGSTALALPRPYVVPGGRFREMYYWDSYFTMLGLRADERGDLIEAMLDDFVSLVERYGHVPNGTRSYYLSRSQPPFLYAMMALSPTRDRAVRQRRLAALRTEHAFFTTPQRTTVMPDGSRLQHYWDARATPRDESYREDVETGRAGGRAAPTVYRNLRAAAESGWDFSSRWLADGRTLATIDTIDIVPADLNALLYGMERRIAEECGALDDAACARDFTGKAEARRAAVERWLWVPADARYADWDSAARTPRPGVTAATLYPLFTGLAAAPRAHAVAGTVAAQLLAPNGLRTTTVATAQQWDRPNGWAPLQWIAVAGLSSYGEDALARMIGTRFLATVEREYRASGKLLEKYDVEQSRAGGGGEYPTQDGFGWTNGVTRALQERYASRH